MFKRTIGKPELRCLRLLLPFCLLFLWSCQKEIKPAAYPSRLNQEIQKVVIVGFRAAMTKGPGPDLVQNPITGTSFLAEPVNEDAVKEMSQMLTDKLMTRKEWKLVPPGQARGVLASLIDGDRKMETPPMEMLQSVGKTFEADAVLIGYLYRWQKRIGTDYAAKRPASVSFDLILVRPSNAAILWRRHFDKTQQSLLADLFDFDTYVKSSGKWLTAEKLADLGLEKLIMEMPGTPKPQKEEKRENSADHTGNRY